MFNGQITLGPWDKETNMMTVEVKCVYCGETHGIEVNRNDFNEWQMGELIQDALPYLNVDQRELLISQTCKTCFDKMLGNFHNEPFISKEGE